MNLGLGRLAALAAACAALAAMLAGVGVAADVGANDDTAKYEADGGARFYAEMAGVGLRESLLTVRFRPSDPTQIPDQDAIDSAVANAARPASESSSPSIRIRHANSRPVSAPPALSPAG